MPPAATASPQWVLHPSHSPEAAQELVRALGVPLAMAHALVNRGIATREAAIRFLEPEIENLHEPSEMLDLERAADRIFAAVRDRERILVHGDYDVDGITSTFLLHSALLELGADAQCRIPARLRDGYGLSVDAIDEAHRRGCKLVVTVDCGITANEAVAHARTLGIDVVVTDHHEPPAVLPEAVAIVNPLRPGCPYPFKSLAGVGVTFKLVERLLRTLGGLDRARNYLDAVALGTIADVVPLVGENRVLARLGLSVLNERKNVGLRALIEQAKLSDKQITSGHVAFVLAPRLNAAGRIGEAEEALQLLQETDPARAEKSAQKLEKLNNERRSMNNAVLEDALDRVKRECGYPDCSSILLWSEGWHAGVIGIVASRLVEEYQRPAVLVALTGDMGRGSGRSLPGLDLTRLLDGCGDLLLSHGGHAFAAGLSVSRDRLPALRERFERLVREQREPGDFVQRLEFDADLTAGECDMELVEWLERMAPHGLGNTEPLFRMSGVNLESVQVVGGGKHLKLRVSDDTGEVETIGFGLGKHADELERAGRADLAFVPTRNEWNGRESVQLKLKGVHAL
ncbi:MAG: single-stranded-DNA-specific exonuclease RecJ [Candidatus Eisenbacteria bacterium]|nr:single-stranded-DNA-specific exonuclease RecJ [Candidatus Eisenbacteria bacterium]